MKMRAAVLLLCLGLAAANEEVIEGEYLIALKAGASREDFVRFSEECSKRSRPEADETEKDPYHIRVVVGKLQALIVSVTEKVLEELKVEFEDLIKYVEPNTVTYSLQQLECPDYQPGYISSWGNKRITSETPYIGPGQQYNANWGKGVDIYMLDTGIDCSHDEFKGRCTYGYTSVGHSAEGLDEKDTNGHGTHCSGIAAGTYVGVAKSASLIAVKVLNGAGRGSASKTLRGFEWAFARYLSQNRPAVFSMSIGGTHSNVETEAMAEIVGAGVVAVAAAGNTAVDACTRSPASAPSVITVTASTVRVEAKDKTPPITDEDRRTPQDQRAFYANHGPCVDIYAPGSTINSSWTGNGYRIFSGTSMACPHVSGAAAAYLSVYPTATPAQVREWLLTNAQKDIIEGTGIVNEDGGKDPNLLLHIPCKSGPDPAVVPSVPEDHVLTEDTCWEQRETVKGGGEIAYPLPGELYPLGTQFCWDVTCKKDEVLRVEYERSRLGVGFVAIDYMTNTGDNNIPPPTVYNASSVLMRFRPGNVAAGGFELKHTCGVPKCFEAPAELQCSASTYVNEAKSVLSTNAMPPTENACWNVQCPAERPIGLLQFQPAVIGGRSSRVSFFSAASTGSVLDTTCLEDGNVARPRVFTREMSVQLTSFDTTSRRGDALVGQLQCKNAAVFTRDDSLAKNPSCITHVGSTVIDYTGGYNTNERSCWRLSCPTISRKNFLAFTAFDVMIDGDSLNVNGADYRGINREYVIPEGEDLSSVSINFQSGSAGTRDGFGLVLFCDEEAEKPVCDKETDVVRLDPYASDVSRCWKMDCPTDKLNVHAELGEGDYLWIDNKKYTGKVQGVINGKEITLQSDARDQGGVYIQCADAPIPPCDTVENVAADQVVSYKSNPSDVKCWAFSCPSEKPYGLLVFDAVDIDPVGDYIAVGSDTTRLSGTSVKPQRFDGSTTMKVVTDIYRTKQSTVSFSYRCSVPPKVVTKADNPADGSCLSSVGSTLIDYTGGYEASEQRCWDLSCPIGSKKNMITLLKLDTTADFFGIAIDDEVGIDGVIYRGREFGKQPIQQGEDFSFRVTFEVINYFFFPSSPDGFQVLLLCEPEEDPMPCENAGNVLHLDSYSNNENRCWEMDCPGQLKVDTDMGSGDSLLVGTALFTGAYHNNQASFSGKVRLETDGASVGNVLVQCSKEDAPACSNPTVLDSEDQTITYRSTGPHDSACWSLRCPADRPYGSVFITSLSLEKYNDFVRMGDRVVLSDDTLPSPHLFVGEVEVRMETDMFYESGSSFSAGYACSAMAATFDAGHRGDKCLESTGTTSIAFTREAAGDNVTACWAVTCPIASEANYAQFTSFDSHNEELVIVNGQDFYGTGDQPLYISRPNEAFFHVWYETNAPAIVGHGFELRVFCAGEPPAPQCESRHARWSGCISNPACCGAGLTCFEKNAYYAQCLKKDECPTDDTNWSCKVLGEGPPVAPTLPGSCTSPKISMWGECTKQHDCCEEGLTCFEQNEYYAQCRQKCYVKDNWSCRALGGELFVLAL